MGSWESNVLRGFYSEPMCMSRDAECPYDHDTPWDEDDEEAMLDDIENDDYEAD